MTDVEQELVTLLKFKGKKYRDRQKYLHALLVTIDDKERCSDDDYDNLTDAAAEWHQAAVVAKDRNQPIPDFDTGTTEEPEPEEPDDAGEEPEPAEDDEADDDEEAEPPAEETNSGADSEPELEDGQHNSSYEEPAGSAEPAEPDSELEEYEADQKAEKKAKRKAAAKARAERPRPPAQPEPDYEKLTGEKDRYGCFVGTKTSQAIKMYEKGANSNDISHALGGRFYNILSKLASRGHLVEKTDHGLWKIVHKDDIANYKATTGTKFKKKKVKA
jgi:hypothetical protein